MTNTSGAEIASIRSHKIPPERIAEFRRIMEEDLGKPIFESEEELSDWMRNVMELLWVLKK